MTSLSAAILVATCTAIFGLHSSSSATSSYSYFAFASELRSLTARSAELRPPMPLAETPPVSGPNKQILPLSLASTPAAASVKHSAAIHAAASLPDLAMSSPIAFTTILRRLVRTIVARCGPQGKGIMSPENARRPAMLSCSGPKSPSNTSAGESLSRPYVRAFDWASNRIAGGALGNGSVLCVLPFDRAADGRLLVSRRHTGGRDRTHGLDKLSGRPRARRICAAFVEPAAILELAVCIVTEEVRRTDRPIPPCDCLRLVVKIGKREIMSFRETLHILK